MSNVEDGGYILITEDRPFIGLFYSSDQAERWAKEHGVEYTAIEYIRFYSHVEADLWSQQTR